MGSFITQGLAWNGEKSAAHSWAKRPFLKGNGRARYWPRIKHDRMTVNFMNFVGGLPRTVWRGYAPISSDEFVFCRFANESYIPVYQRSGWGRTPAAGNEIFGIHHSGLMDLSLKVDQRSRKPRGYWYKGTLYEPHPSGFFTTMPYLRRLLRIVGSPLR